ncbi:coatomer subunit delta [Myxozyma melibiosi]|uniref:Coatomer subunit delta n=1 Tax=Myxozyma melibiosi TaxID=54550 RepID=A0ABR1FAZ5_9ASCO
MVVLAASVCTRGGKAVLSRQFRDMPKSRIEALLAAFPKLTHKGTQHTTVEDENVRYVYQPLEELYMVLITNKQSNILQDIDTLHLFSQIVTTLCKSSDEREILANAFELLSAFDEIVALGYRENLTLSQIRTNLEMDSHEEKIQEIIARNKELEANEERKRRAKQFDMQRREAAKRGTPSFASRSSSFPSHGDYAVSAAAQTAAHAESSYDDYRPGGAATKPSAPRGKGMQLGKKSKATDMYEHVRAEIGIEDTTPTRTPEPEPVSRTSAAASPSPYADNDGIIVSVVEAVNGQFSRLGEIVNVEVRGDLQLRIADPAVSKIRLAVDLPGNVASFKTHPNVDKALFSSSKLIGLKDPARGFPSNNNPLGVLRWRLTGAGDAAGAALAPLGITCWLSDSGASTFQVTIEYELRAEDAVLENVIITIPIPSEAAEVNSSDVEYMHEGDHIKWIIPVISEADGASGSFDFTAEADDENDFFPMGVSFRKTTPFAPIDVRDVVLVESGESVEFTKEVKVETDKYEIV